MAKAVWQGRCGLGLVLLAGGVHASERVVDEMDDPRAWTLQVTDPGQARLLSVSGANGGRALCVDFDFGALPGRLSLSRDIGLSLPGQGQFQLQWRGKASQASVQLQGVDSSGAVRWSGAVAAAEMASGWQPLRLPLAGAGRGIAVSALRWTLSSPAGGAGLVCLDRLQLRSAPAEDGPLKATALADTATALQQRMVDGRRDTLWVSSGVKQQTVSLDLGQVRELGGLQVDWAAGLRATDYQVQASSDGRRWKPLRQVQAATGTTDRLRFGSVDARYLRLDLRDGPNWRYGIVDLLVQPPAWGSSMASFLSTIGPQLPAGTLPPSLGRKPQAWKVIGAAQASAPAWIGADGSIETRPGQFSVQPWVQVDGSWLGSDQVQLAAQAADPGQAATGWEHAQLRLSLLAQTVHTQGSGAWVHARYRLHNPDTREHRYSLALALRPFVLAPAALPADVPGGIGRIEQLQIDGARALVNGQLALRAGSAPEAGFASHFDAGLELAHLRSASLPTTTQASDAQGLASGAMVWRWQLAPGQSRELELWLPMAGTQSGQAPPGTLVKGESIRAGSGLVLPGKQGEVLTHAWQAALARIHAERAGPWLRVDSRQQIGASDGQAAQMARALYRAGDLAPVAEWLMAHAPMLDPADCIGWSQWLQLAAGLSVQQAWPALHRDAVHGYASLAETAFGQGGQCAAAVAAPRLEAAQQDLRTLLPPLGSETALATAATQHSNAAEQEPPSLELPAAASAQAREALLQQALARLGGQGLPSGWQQWRSDGVSGLVDASQAASQVLAIADLLLDEQGDRLHLAPGLPADWLAGDGVQVRDLATRWGRFGYHSRRQGDAWVIDFAAGTVLPPAGLLIDWPWEGEPGQAHADDQLLEWQQGRLLLTRLPQQLRISLPAARR